MAKAKQLHTYRLLYVDNYNIKPHIDMLVEAYNKHDAEEKGYCEIEYLAKQDLRYITQGAARMQYGARRISGEYFSYLVHGSWSLVECEKCVSISKHETKRGAEDIAASANKKRQANGKKRRWTAAEKAARKAQQNA